MVNLVVAKRLKYCLYYDYTIRIYTCTDRTGQLKNVLSLNPPQGLNLGHIFKRNEFKFICIKITKTYLGANNNLMVLITIYRANKKYRSTNHYPKLCQCILTPKRLIYLFGYKLGTIY